MVTRCWLAGGRGLMGCLALLLLVSVAAAQDLDPPAGDENANGIRFGEPVTHQWQAGLMITAKGGTCVGVLGTVPVPTDWPEQDVKIIGRDVTAGVRVGFRTLNNGVKQMLVSIPRLNAGATAQAVLTFEVTRRPIQPPMNVDQLKIPKRTPRAVGIYVGTSPYIEVRDAKIRDRARQITRDHEGTDWQKVEKIYDWVRDNVKYEEGKLKGAVAALRDGTGDCEELTSLFIALCRANRIPARTVWVPDHCYPEFYVEDADGKGHWIPCQAAGTRAFGSMPESRPILQKGDNFKVPEKRTPQRYVAEHLKVKSVSGGGSPEVRFVRKKLE